MSTPRKITRRSKPRFKPGDWIAYNLGPSRHVAQVIETYGPVGKEQVFYCRLKEPMWYGEPGDFDFPETSLEPATPSDLDRRYPPEEKAAHAS